MQKGLKMAIRILGGLKRTGRIIGRSQFTVAGWTKSPPQRQIKPTKQAKALMLAELNKIPGIHFEEADLEQLGD